MVMANIYIKATMPEELLRPFLQSFKDWEHEKDTEVLAEVVVNIPGAKDRIVALLNDLGIPCQGEVRWAEKEQDMEWRVDE